MPRGVDDADFAAAIPLAIQAGFINSGQACIVDTRVLVPRHRMEEASTLIQAAAAGLRVGDPRTGPTDIGPVLCVIGYAGDEEAIAIANDTVYGLQASVHSADVSRARAVASRLLAGRVQVDGSHHQPMAPFGGFKQSGIGREFGVFGLEAFLEPRSVLGLHRATA